MSFFYPPMSILYIPTIYLGLKKTDSKFPDIDIKKRQIQSKYLKHH